MCSDHSATDTDTARAAERTKQQGIVVGRIFRSVPQAAPGANIVSRVCAPAHPTKATSRNDHEFGTVVVPARQ
jgi:hypothetical protein